MKRLTVGLPTVMLLLALVPLPAKAVPLLQLYIEGAVYDSATESWVLENAGDAVRLWTIGNVDGPGGRGPLYNVRVAIAYAEAPDVVITLTASSTGGYGGFFDPSLSAAAVYLQTVSDGSTPLLSDGSSLPNHGAYGDGVEWQEFALGDFSLTDSPMADFIDTFPTAPAEASGQISVYEVSVMGTNSLHFDLYDSYEGATRAKAVFAPFSHDSHTTVPEPAPLALIALGLFALALLRRRRTAA